jgi:class 3 adenylate cyclase
MDTSSGIAAWHGVGCGDEKRPGARFCEACDCQRHDGQALTTAGEHRTAGSAEHKQVSVLSADIVDSMRLTEALGAVTAGRHTVVMCDLEALRGYARPAEA